MCKEQKIANLNCLPRKRVDLIFSEMKKKKKKSFFNFRRKKDKLDTVSWSRSWLRPGANEFQNGCENQVTKPERATEDALKSENATESFINAITAKLKKIDMPMTRGRSGFCFDNFSRNVSHNLGRSSKKFAPVMQKPMKEYLPIRFFSCFRGKKIKVINDKQP